MECVSEFPDLVIPGICREIVTDGPTYVYPHRNIPKDLSYSHVLMLLGL